MHAECCVCTLSTIPSRRWDNISNDTNVLYQNLFKIYCIEIPNNLYKNMIISITKYLKVNQLDQNIFLKYNVNF